jgi:hypothetical protein
MNLFSNIFKKSQSITLDLILFSFIILNLEESYISPIFIACLDICLSLLMTRVTLRKFNILLFIIVGVFGFSLGRLMLKQFLFKEYSITNDFFVLTVFLTTLISLLFVNNEDLDEYSKSFAAGTIIRQLTKVCLTYKYLYFFKRFHSDKISNLNTLDSIKENLNIEIFWLFIDFISQNIGLIIRMSIRALYSQKNKKKYLMIISRMFLFIFFAKILFLLNYNLKFLDFVYKSVNYYFNQPYNVHLYNLIPSELDKRFKIGMLVLFGIVI